MEVKKSYGQHFLKDVSLAKKIVSDANPKGFDVVVEVGPGPGTLTKWIDHEKMVLIEADKDFIEDLEKDYPNAYILRADAAQVDYVSCLEKVGGAKNWLLIGNLPYNASAAIVSQALRASIPPQELVVMVQKEQADRMLARKGDMSLLSVAIQIYTTPTRLFDVQPGSFIPPPKVKSTVLRLVYRKDTPEKPEEILALAKIGFSSRRKQLHKNLANADIAPSEIVKEVLKKYDIPENARAQELSVDDWVNIATDIL